MSKPTLLEVAGKICAQAKFKRTYADKDDDIEKFAAFFQEWWKEHKKDVLTDAAERDSGLYCGDFTIPKGLAFTDNDLEAIVLDIIEDFQGLKGKVFVHEGDGPDHFRLSINFRAERDEAWNELKMEKRKRVLSQGSDAKKAKKADKEEAVKEEAVKEEDAEPHPGTLGIKAPVAPPPLTRSPTVAA